ncbi:MAG: AraC family transcriptional regulator [Oscillospiraceae bacterium]|nr:AraC family transcriptional regulator [Oscillospiraceae bacterium]
MKINFIGYNHSHEKNFEINRPYGSGNYLLLLFKSPAFAEINGSRLKIRENSFIIYDVGSPQHYGACEHTYVNDWIHFSLEEEEVNFFAEHNIPLDTPVYAGSLTEHSEAIRGLCFEHNSEAEYKSESIDLQLRLLLIKLSRSMSGSNVSRANVDDTRYYIMQQIRSMIFSTHPMTLSVEELARQAAMSRSYFQRTYKKLFGESVITDIISSRLEYAKLLLATTDYSVKEIAEKCGYENDVHFMRQFKSHTGLTPSLYRKCF